VHHAPARAETTFSRSTETTARSFSIVSSISLRAAATKPVGAATGDDGAYWSSAAALACELASSAATAPAAARLRERGRPEAERELLERMEAGGEVRARGFESR